MTYLFLVFALLHTFITRNEMINLYFDLHTGTVIVQRRNNIYMLIKFIFVNKHYF